MHKSRRALQAETDNLELELPKAESNPLMMSASEAILRFISKESRAADPTISAAREATEAEVRVRRVGSRERMGLLMEWPSLFRHFLTKGRSESGF